jgi:2-succinyl-5-enolpyruvyl-6-hydroxy-3-cyclohexene-1-carboxylate synthase
LVDDGAPSSSGSVATDWAVAVLASLVDAGVREVVLCPGSRSQALALAAAEFERAGRR